MRLDLTQLLRRLHHSSCPPEALDRSAGQGADRTCDLLLLQATACCKPSDTCRGFLKKKVFDIWPPNKDPLTFLAEHVDSLVCPQTDPPPQHDWNPKMKCTQATKAESRYLVPKLTSPLHPKGLHGAY